MTNRAVIAASEIGEFLYCQRCWYRRVHGFLGKTETVAMVRGTRQHTALLSAVETIDHRGILVRRLLLGSAVLFLILLILFALVSRYA
jgi:hypothetical protein